MVSCPKSLVKSEALTTMMVFHITAQTLAIFFARSRDIRPQMGRAISPSPIKLLRTYAGAIHVCQFSNLITLRHIRTSLAMRSRLSFVPVLALSLQNSVIREASLTHCSSGIHASSTTYNDFVQFLKSASDVRNPVHFKVWGLSGRAFQNGVNKPSRCLILKQRPVLGSSSKTTQGTFFYFCKIGN